MFGHTDCRCSDTQTDVRTHRQNVRTDEQTYGSKKSVDVLRFEIHQETKKFGQEELEVCYEQRQNGNPYQVVLISILLIAMLRKLGITWLTYWTPPTPEGRGKRRRSRRFREFF